MHNFVIATVSVALSHGYPLAGEDLGPRNPTQTQSQVLSPPDRASSCLLTDRAVLFAFSALSFVFALDNASPGVVVILINTSPMWAVVFAAIVLREKLTRLALGGGALSLAGIFVVLAFR